MGNEAGAIRNRARTEPDIMANPISLRAVGRIVAGVALILAITMVSMVFLGVIPLGAPSQRVTAAALDFVQAHQKKVSAWTQAAIVELELANPPQSQAAAEWRAFAAIANEPLAEIRIHVLENKLDSALQLTKGARENVSDEESRDGIERILRTVRVCTRFVLALRDAQGANP